MKLTQKLAKLLKVSKDAYAAGVVIGLCSFIYSTCINKQVGAFLFGLGLVTICYFKLNLFTGKVGSSNDIKYLLLIFIFNFLGAYTIRMIVQNVPEYLVRGLMCGMLMQIGVASYKQNQLITIMCVAAFILSGSKHCIAMIYNPITTKWITVIIGNIIGAKLMYFLGVKDNGNGNRSNTD